MPTNLTPQYHKAEEHYRRAATIDEELKWLEVMLQQIPKHKGSEKLQADLKQRISRARKAVEAQRTSGKKPAPFRIPRQGAGTAILLGPPNSGKSQLLAALTRATPEIASYPFTTRAPLPGMMEWEDVAIQLVDTPPVTADYIEPYLLDMIRSADLVMLVVDLTAEDTIEQLQDVLAKLASTRTRLARDSYLDEDDIGVSYTRTLLVLNKSDSPDALAAIELLHEALELGYDEVAVSALSGDGLDELRRAIFSAIGIIRVYTKLPAAKEPDLARPFTLRHGSTVEDVADLIHEDLRANLKSARVWGTGIGDAVVVKRDHVLADKDIVELHV